MTEIDDLIKQRDEAAKAYYEGETLLTDYEFDQLTVKLEAAGVSQQVGHGYTPTGETIRHEYALLSLKKVFGLKDIDNWAKGQKIKSYLIQPKYDGNALNLVYAADGKFSYAVTRGDGIKGEDVTHTIKTMIDLGLIPATVPVADGNTHILCECIMTFPNFEALNKEQDDREYSTPRNSVAGLLRRKTTELAKYLSIVAYDSNRYVGDEIEWLAERGFTTPADHFYKKVEGTKELETILAELYEKIENEFDFDVDGAVIKLVASRATRESIGNSTSYPRWAIAYKYPDVTYTTTIRDIVWNLSRKGRLAPVAVFDQVIMVGNAKTTMATLHNHAQFQLHGFHEGDTIKLKRSGKVIPFIMGAVDDDKRGKGKKFEAPATFNGEDVIVDGTYLRINGVNHVAKIVYALKSLDINGVSDKLVAKLLEAKMIENVLDIFALSADDFAGLDRMGAGSGANAYNALQTAFEQPMWRWIAAMGMPFIAKTKSPILESRYDSLDALAKASLAELTTLEGFGSEKAGSVYENREMIADWAKRLREEYNFVPAPEEKAAVATDSKYSGKKIVVTGTFPTMKRGDVEAWLKAKGATISSGVSSATDLLVAGEKAGTKLDKAQAAGVDIMSGADFEKEVNAEK